MTVIWKTIEDHTEYLAMKEHDKIVAVKNTLGNKTIYILHLNTKTNNKLLMYKIVLNSLDLDIHAEHKAIYKPLAGISSKKIKKELRRANAKQAYMYLEKLYQQLKQYWSIT